MSYATIQVKPLTPRLGAEISSIDLSTTLSNQQVEDLHTALAEHQVLFFRDQKPFDALRMPTGAASAAVPPGSRPHRRRTRARHGVRR